MACLILCDLRGFLINFRALAFVQQNLVQKSEKRSQAVQMVAKEEVEVAFLHNQCHGLFPPHSPTENSPTRWR